MKTAYAKNKQLEKKRKRSDMKILIQLLKKLSEADAHRFNMHVDNMPTKIPLYTRA